MILSDENFFPIFDSSELNSEFEATAVLLSGQSHLSSAQPVARRLK